MESARALLSSLGIALACCAAFAGTAEAAEHVMGGDFDAVVCDNMSCPLGGWAVGTTAYTGPGMIATGPRCGPLRPQCANDGSGYTTAPNWARLGAGSGATGIAFVESVLGQSVTIPAGGQSTLRFNVHIPADPANLLSSHLAVKLGGTTVFSLDRSAAPAYSVYQPVAIDVTAFGGGTRYLEFRGNSTVATGPAPGFDIDDVSLQDTPASAAPTQGNPTPVTTGVTGQRAAALAKCKKKKKKKRSAGKKCRQKAALLPL